MRDDDGSSYGMLFDGCRTSTDDEQGRHTDPGAGAGPQGPDPAPFGGAPVGEAPVGAPDLVVLLEAMPPILSGDLGVMEAVVWAVSCRYPALSWKERASLVSSLTSRPVSEGAARKCLCMARRKGYDVPAEK